MPHNKFEFILITVQRDATQSSLFIILHPSNSTRGYVYSFVYAWWWVWLTPKTHTVNLQN